MTDTEKAWSSLNQLYKPDVEDSEDSNSTKQIKRSLRELQKMRLSVKCIDLIQEAICGATCKILEDTECEECGLRCDGRIKCEKCGLMVNISHYDQHEEVCYDCQSDDEGDDDETETET